VCMVGFGGRGEGEWRRLKCGYMANGLNIAIWNRTKKLLAIALSESGGDWGREMMEAM
jgi:hypothetical protein